MVQNVPDSISRCKERRVLCDVRHFVAELCSKSTVARGTYGYSINQYSNLGPTWLLERCARAADLYDVTRLDCSFPLSLLPNTNLYSRFLVVREVEQCMLIE
jgi:hypothetical protein